MSTLGLRCINKTDIASISFSGIMLHGKEIHVLKKYSPSTQTQNFVLGDINI